MSTAYTLEYDRFAEAYGRARYLFDSGQVRRLDLEPAYGPFSDLFRVGELETLRAEAEGGFFERERKAARYLRAAALEQHLGAAVRPLTEEIETHDARATVSWEGRDVPLRATPSLLADEPRADARRALASRAESVLDETNDLRAERLEHMHERAVALGAASVLALHAESTTLDVDTLASSARRLLTDSERPYVEALDRVVSRADMRRGDATSEDLRFALRGAEFDRAFPTARLPSVYRDVLGGVGIRAGAQPQVRLDLEKRSRKRDGSFVARIRVPDEVVVVVRPAGGYHDVRRMLREAGRAQHAAFTSPNAAVAFRRTGDPATAAAFGALFEGLMLDDEFLVERFPIGRGGPLGALAAVQRAWSVRRDAGLVAYGIGLFGSGRAAGARERYVDVLGEATCVRVTAAAYLADVDDGFAAASRLRAAALEVHLRDALKTRFGRRWWTTRTAGELLKELWSTGSEYSADELASELALGEIAIDPLVDDVVGGLSR